jgi:hypothetical protein
LQADLCALAPDNGVDLTPLVKAIEKEDPALPTADPPWVRLAALQHRAGRVAAEVLERAEAQARNGRAPRAWLLLALIHHQGGRAAEARAWLDKAVRWLGTDWSEAADRPDWEAVLEARVLRREVEEALAKPR